MPAYYTPRLLGYSRALSDVPFGVIASAWGSGVVQAETSSCVSSALTRLVDSLVRDVESQNRERKRIKEKLH